MLKPGSWAGQNEGPGTAGSNSGVPGCSEDGAFYFASVKSSQQELNAAGSSVPAAAGAAAGVSNLSAAGGGLHAARLGPEFCRLRAATQAALEAAGLTQLAAGALAGSSSTAVINSSDSSSSDRSSSAAVSSMDAESNRTTVDAVEDNGEGRRQQEEDETPPGPEALCNVGSWQSSTGADASEASGSEAAEPEVEAMVGGDVASSTASADASSPEGHDGDVVAPEDVVLAQEASGALNAADAGQYIHTDMGDMGDLYDLD